MNLLNKLTIFLLLTGMSFVSGPILGQIVSADNSLFTLYPPLNLQGSAVECNSYLHWQKPQMPDGTTPAGLMGYYIYRDGMMVTYISGADYLSYYDYNMETGTFSYTITANYDLAFYGIPGQFGESPPAGPVTIALNCCCSMPFYEPWDLGSFTYQNWQFVPAQGNWAMNTSQGNPAPSAVFNSTPAIQNYDVTMKSMSLQCEHWICADIYLEFDYKLVDIATGGTEKLIVEYFMDNTWFTAVEVKNEGSTGWIHQKVDISQVCGKTCRLGFKVTGPNSTNISNWSVDNIKLSPVCKGPASCNYIKTGNVITLFWQPPPCDNPAVVAGYNVYRTLNATGLPPFIKLNNAMISSLEYNDAIPSTISNAHYKYVITGVQKVIATNELLCEAPCDTLVVDYISGIKQLNNDAFDIYPNPAVDLINVKSSRAVESWELFDIIGTKVLQNKVEYLTDFSIPVGAIPSGIYLVRIKNAAGTFISKVTVMH